MKAAKLKAEAERRAHSDLSAGRYTFRGAALELQMCDLPELIISGPAETGKTIAALTRLHNLMWRHPGAQGVIMRKVYEHAIASVVQTFRSKVLPAESGVAAYGGEKAEWFDYPNGSRIWIGGIDKPGKTLSTERDVIYVNQAEELALEDWETLTTRATGRAGHIPFGQVLGDCNPAGSYHWILSRPRLKVLESVHQDNPALYDDAGALTEQGQRTMETLEALTGARRERLFRGRWAQAEGVVYDNFSADNLTDDEPDPGLPFELCADDGYVDPRVILFIQRTPGRILVFDEIYHSRHLAETCVNEAVARCGKWFGWADEEKTRPAKLPEICVGPDEAKELQQRFRLANIPYRGGTHKPLTAGIDVVRRLIRDAQGYCAIQVRKHCTNLVNELSDGYRYPDPGKRSQDDVPIDANNHAVDGLRYWCWLRARR